MSKALPGEHYCAGHQGNHSHYAPHNCTVCTQATEIERLRAELADMDQVLCLYLMQQNDLRAENAEFQQELTKGIHTCGPTCRKTARCAEMADLREELVDTKAALFSAEMRAKSAEKPDCRVCIWFSEDDSAYCGVQSPLVCINGDAYSPADPVRLYDMGVR